MAGIKPNLVERYSNGQNVVSEGVLSSKCYVILSGKVRVSKKKDNRTVTVALLREGDTFGEMGLFQDTVRSATATAVGDVEVGVIDKADFKKMLSACPDNMRYIVNSLVNRLRLTTNSLVAIGVQLEKAKKSLDPFALKDQLH
ncbi:MAG: cyclic nucleotide-binding domain-containing protein [Nitrospinae bacterium]|nr:cyclic nucleotide-binding domain-containing protein [Nitrospinota bacterium]